MVGKNRFGLRLDTSLLVALTAFSLSSCTAELAPGNAQQYTQQTQVASPTSVATTAATIDMREVEAAQAAQARKTQVTIAARVFKLLPDDTRGLPHQRFLLQLDNGTTVLIAHDTKLAPHVPVQPGDFVRIHGEYIWNNKGGVIHWTHHDPRGRHDPGWIEFNGLRYQ